MLWPCYYLNRGMKKHPEANEVSLQFHLIENFNKDLTINTIDFLLLWCGKNISKRKMRYNARICY